jgi:hypothetical protein
LEDNFKKYEIKTIFSNEKKTEKYHPDAIDKYIEEYLYSINITAFIILPTNMGNSGGIST